MKREESLSLRVLASITVLGLEVVYAQALDMIQGGPWLGL